MLKMQHVAQNNDDDIKIESDSDSPKAGNSSSTPCTPPYSPPLSPAFSPPLSPINHPGLIAEAFRYISSAESSESVEDITDQVESYFIDTDVLTEEAKARISSKFLLPFEQSDHEVDPETQLKLRTLLKAAGLSKLTSSDGKQLADGEVLRRLTSSVTCALDEAAAALTKMRSDSRQASKRALIKACTQGNVNAVKKLLKQGASVNETSEEGDSLLALACSAGYYELVQVLLSMNASVEDRGSKGDCTPLMEAASSGHVDVVRLLLAHGAHINAQSSTGNTPLMYACAAGHVQVVKVLLDAGANIEDHNENGHTPLMEAASAGHVPVAKILLEYGAGINTHSSEFKESALTLACYKGHLEMVNFLLLAGADQEHKTDEMHTALMEASMDGHVDVARLLLDSGAQVNMPTDSFESPLTLAACGGHVELAILLIERGANIEEVNDEGYTPLMEAAREGHEEIVAVLLERGADINAQTEETQESALTLACCGGFLEVVDYLVKHNADLELGASTALMEAAQEGHLEVVRYLLEAGANVHAKTATNDTALTYACENGHTEVVELLLQYGAYIEEPAEGGRTPLMKSCRAGHLSTVEFLVKKKANVNRRTINNDHTPLSLACAGGHIAIVQFLLENGADPFHKLKDNSTMLIEAAKGGHTNVVQLLLDYPQKLADKNNNETQEAESDAVYNYALSPIPENVPSTQNTEDNSISSRLPSDNQSDQSNKPKSEDTVNTEGNEKKSTDLKQNSPEQQKPLSSQQSKSNQAQSQQSKSVVQQSKTVNSQAQQSQSNKSSNQPSEQSQTKIQPVQQQQQCSTQLSLHQQCVQAAMPSQQCAHTQMQATQQQCSQPQLKQQQQCTQQSSQAQQQCMHSSQMQIQPFVPKMKKQLNLQLKLRQQYVYDDDDDEEEEDEELEPSAEGDFYHPTREQLSALLEPIQQYPKENFVSTIEQHYFERQCMVEEMQKVENQLNGSENISGLAVTSSTLIPVPVTAFDMNTTQSFPAFTQTLQNNSAMLRNTFYVNEQQSVPHSSASPVSPSVSTAVALSPINNNTNNSTNTPSSSSSLIPINDILQQISIGDRPKAKATKKDGKVTRKTSSSLLSQLQSVAPKQSCQQQQQQSSEECSTAEKTVSQQQSNQEQQVQEAMQQQQNAAHQFSFRANGNAQFIHMQPSSTTTATGQVQHLTVQRQRLLQQQVQFHHFHQQLAGDRGGTAGVVITAEEHTLAAQAAAYQAMMQQQQQQTQALHFKHIAQMNAQLQHQARQNIVEHSTYCNIAHQSDDEVVAEAQALIKNLNNSVKMISNPNLSKDEILKELKLMQHMLQCDDTFDMMAKENRAEDLGRLILEEINNMMAGIEPDKLCEIHRHEIDKSFGELKTAVCALMNSENDFTATGNQPTENAIQCFSSNNNAINSNNSQVIQTCSATQHHHHQQSQQQQTPQKVQKPCCQLHSPPSGTQLCQQHLLPTGLPSFQQQLLAQTQQHHMHLQQQQSVQGQQQLQQAIMQQQQQIRLSNPTQQQLQHLQQHLTHKQQQQQQEIHNHIQKHHPALQQLIQQKQQQQQKTTQQQQQQVMQQQKTSISSSPTTQQSQLIMQKNQQLQHQQQQIAQQKPASQGAQQQIITQQKTTQQQQKTGQQPLNKNGQAQPQIVQQKGQPQQHQKVSGQQHQKLPGQQPQPQHAYGVSSKSKQDLQRQINHSKTNNGSANASTVTSTASTQTTEKKQGPTLLRGKKVKSSQQQRVPAIGSGNYNNIDVNNARFPATNTTYDQPSNFVIDVDSETESNHDTALTLACAGGHEELVELLLSRGADIEHRDKKGFTPLILAATAGHEKVVELLLNNNADIEAQSERTKDTPLSLACSGGRYEVVELLLNRGANKEHRNVSDYTPLSLAASGGYVNIIKLLLSNGAEINSRTGSKLGISPLMLAAMNGHTAAVKVLLDMGSDINAQIETNRNTALTLACFQGRHEVVSLLLDRKANVEHRAKTGLTPLMEAASGGYVDVGRVLLDKGADVNAPPVPNSRDTALTIASDKGHGRFVELLLSRNAQIEVRNKKGNTPLWLAASGGHLSVVELLYTVGANIDAQDNRKVSCLVAAFRKGHVKVVKWMVNHVTQFPSDQEMTRYITTLNDKDLLDKCQECMKIIRYTKDQEAAKANKYASILLEELDMERSREELKKAAAARRKERKKQKRLEKKEGKRRQMADENDAEEEPEEKEPDEDDSEDEEEIPTELVKPKKDFTKSAKKNIPLDHSSHKNNQHGDMEEGDSGIDANSLGSCSSNEVKLTKITNNELPKEKKNKKQQSNISNSNNTSGNNTSTNNSSSKKREQSRNTNESSSSNASTQNNKKEKKSSSAGSSARQAQQQQQQQQALQSSKSKNVNSNNESKSSKQHDKNNSQNSESSNSITKQSTNLEKKGKQNSKNGSTTSSSDAFSQHGAIAKHSIDKSNSNGNVTTNEHRAGNKDNASNRKHRQMSFGVDDIDESTNASVASAMSQGLTVANTNNSSSDWDEDGWKEVVRKYLNPSYRPKRVTVPASAISRVIGRGGCNINAIRNATGASIEIEKQKGQGDRTIFLKGSAEASRQAHMLISALIDDPDTDIKQMTAAWEKSTQQGQKGGAKSTNSAAPPSNGSATGSLPVKPPAQVTPQSLAPITSQTISSFSKLSFPSPQVVNTVLSASSTFTPTIRAPMTMTRAAPPRVATLSTNEKKPAMVNVNQTVISVGNVSSPSSLTTTTKTTMSYTSAMMTCGGKTPTTGRSASATVITNSAVSGTAATSQTFASKLQESVPKDTIQTVSLSAAAAAPPISSIHIKPTVTMATSSGTISSAPPNKPPFSMNCFSNDQSSATVVTTAVTTSSTSGIASSSPPTQTQQQTQALVTTTATTTIITRNQPKVTTLQVTTVTTSTFQSTVATTTTTFEYSLFNDTLSKVTQQTVWGRDVVDINVSKNSSFGNVMNNGLSSSITSNIHSSFLDVDPPIQIDASKAPGYRGSMTSPSMQKSLSSSSMPMSSASQFSPIRSLSEASNTSLAVARPSSSSITSSMESHTFTPRALFPAVDKQSAAANNLFVREQPNNILKLSSVGNDSQPLLSSSQFHHALNYNTPSQVTTTVSMSRLNPRAPDFSANVKQVTSIGPTHQPPPPLFNQSQPPPPPFIPPTQQPPPLTGGAGISVSGGVLPPNTNLSFPVGKYPAPPSVAQSPQQQQQQQQQQQNQQRTNSSSWLLMNHSQHTSFPQQHHDLLNFSTPTTFGNFVPNQNSEILAGLENGINNLNVSPNSPHGIATNGIEFRSDERKIPKPIGTERSWRIERDRPLSVDSGVDQNNWMLDQKISSWSSPMYRNNHLSNNSSNSNNNSANSSSMPSSTVAIPTGATNQFSRVPVPDEIRPPILENSYQSDHFNGVLQNHPMLSNQMQTLMPPINMGHAGPGPVLPSIGHEIGHPDSFKVESGWDPNRLCMSEISPLMNSDKQHQPQQHHQQQPAQGWTLPWNH